VAADIIRTVAIDTTLMSLATLAALVLVRTFLGWTITLDVEGRWPWQAAKGAAPAPREAPGGAPPPKGGSPAGARTAAGAGGGD